MNVETTPLDLIIDKECIRWNGVEKFLETVPGVELVKNFGFSKQHCGAIYAYLKGVAKTASEE